MSPIPNPYTQAVHRATHRRRPVFHRLSQGLSTGSLGSVTCRFVWLPAPDQVLFVAWADFSGENVAPVTREGSRSPESVVPGLFDHGAGTTMEG
jgi:hypothetical protein